MLNNSKKNCIFANSFETSRLLSAGNEGEIVVCKRIKLINKNLGKEK